ncbi:molybdenum ABC transporter ATP-binding protein ModC [Vibrio sp. S9_S30]|uniref:molybdenum ABC transporter ATP-binding protein ModC n=1 Tax=Vibrio sp. S9_S30 TaxID=2720226 RepID=UPI0016816514|nr:molybdenum ABC transporter ATP-binding protein ModC [Vibrio sp. S9_S30]MBD1559061.1 molybdenum ABC transporter ATP-binding protein ModC [Vibrio sp. S9_S30]
MIRIKVKQQLGPLNLDVDLSLPSKGITAVFGRSGAGKTSLINTVAGLSVPDDGRIEVNGNTLFCRASNQNVPIEKRQIGYVFQEARLFPHYSVKGNLMYGVDERDDSYFQTICELLQLHSLLSRKPVDLSGGEKQRVAIGRALLSKPSLLIMDEPLASLDLPRKREVMPFLERLANDVDVPILYVSHSLNEIIRLADYMIILDQGKLEAAGSLESVWDSQAMRPWQSFSEQSTLFDALVDSHHTKYALTRLKLSDKTRLWVQKIDADISTSVRVQVRANDVSLCLSEPHDTSIRNVIPATIVEMKTHSPSPDKQSVAIKLKLSDQCSLWCNVTQWAVDDLNLNIGKRLYAQIKGVSVTQRDIIQH